MRKFCFLTALVLLGTIQIIAQTTLLPFQSSWKFLDNGTDQGTAWRSNSFNDGSWKTGTGKFGYGISDARTVVSFGTKPTKKHITTYFRRTVNIANAATFSSYTLNLKRDDGAVVYVNGNEVWRTNMPGGIIVEKTLASSATDGVIPVSTTLPANTFVTGGNLIAVEIHQNSSNTPDMAFDLELIGMAASTTAPTLTSVSITSNNSNSSLARTGNLVTLNFTASQTINTPVVTIATRSVTATHNGGNAYTASYTMASNDAEGIVPFTIDFTGTNGVAGTRVTSTTNGSSVRFDRTAPAVTAINRQNPASETTSATSLTFRATFTERVSGVDAADFTFTTNTGSTTGSVNTVAAIGTDGTTYDVTAGSVSGNGTVRLDLKPSGTGIADAAGNAISSGYTSGQTYTIDQAAPSLTTVTIASNNANTSLAKTGDVVTLNFTASQPIQTPTVTIAGKTVAASSTGGNSFTASYTMTSTDAEGLVPFTIDFIGTNGVAGTRVTSTTNGSSVRFDRTAPTVVSINRQNPTTESTSATSLTYRVTFSERVSGVDHTDFTFTTVSGTTTGTLAAGAVVAVGTDGTVYDVTVSSVSGNGTVRLDLKASGTGIADAAGNNISSGFTTGQTYTVSQQTTPPPPVNNTPIPYKSVWKYLDNGTDQGTAWRGTAFDDAAWKSGPAELGYGDGDEATVVSFGPSSSTKYITTYFRKTIQITNPADYGSFTGNIKRDDGAVVYVNGTEVFRSNLPAGTIAFNTTASLANDDGATPQTFSIPTSVFVSGNNVIAVEIHQEGPGSSDISFDLQLTGASASAPKVNSINRQNPTTETTSASTLTYRAIFSKKVNGVDYTDFVITPVSGTVSGTIAANAVTAVGTDGTTYDVTVTAVGGTGSIRLDLKASGTGITDVDGTPISGGFTNGQTYIIEQPASGNMLIPYKSVWKYLDNGTDQGTAWRGTAFDDAAWKSGPAELGYGDGDEATVVSFGPSSNAKYITTYFRKTIHVADASKFFSYTLNLKRDDGAVVYINGTEVFRTNLPAGTIAFNTTASLANDDGATPQTKTLAAGALQNGNNVIAVEIHQEGTGSSDITFDLELTGATEPTPPALTRGPYLQMANQSAVTVRWRTDLPTDSKVEVGTTLGTYTLAASNPAQTTEHEIRITGLAADTRYFYRVGSSTHVLQSGANNYFTTAPAAATMRKMRFAFYGDCGRNENNNQTNTLNAYLNHVGSNPAELMILIGDNAYQNGTDEEYQRGFFTPYSGSLLKNHVLFPTPGNHEYYSTNSRSRSGAYYQNFTMPTAAECGGVASGTKSFYSYDWGNVHFLILDSYGVEADNTRLYDTLGPQVTWLKRDLAANTKPWVVAVFHHPPHTMGSHNSDTEHELVQLRQNFIRILERNGVDLVVSGHSHNYERSYLLDNFYGTEATFNTAAHTKSTSSAKYDNNTNSCPYFTATGASNKGTVYVVSGSSGALGGIQAGYPHDAMPFSQNEGGMFYLEVEGNRMDAKFIRNNGTIGDQFTIMQNVNKTSNVTIQTGTSTTLTASWVGTYSWSNGATTRSITVSPTSNTSYEVTDGKNCTTDKFNVSVSGSSNNITPANSRGAMINAAITEPEIVPSLVRSGQQVTVRSMTNLPTQALVADENGRTLRTFRFTGNTQMNTSDMAAGTYFIKLMVNGRLYTRKFVIIH